MANVIVVGAQWGDEGKGKIVDLLTAHFDIVARYQGGHNAGHTVIVNGRKFVLHLIPSGILHPDKICVIGNGVVVDLAALKAEIDALAAAGIDCTDRLFISDRCHLLFEYHRASEALEELRRGDRKIGTTNRGIGPAYEDKFGRRGARICDLKFPEVLREIVAANLQEKSAPREDGAGLVSGEELLERTMRLAGELSAYFADTSSLLNEAMDGGKRVLFEGAQGTLLDVDHGTYPFVTASSATAGGACTGTGVGPTRIDGVIGIIKAYTTRVGAGPFPTETSGPAGDLMRDRGKEYGASTGRPRRCGWFDAVVVDRARMVNHLDSLVLTKLDVLDAMEEIQLCTGYRYKGSRLKTFPPEIRVLEQCEPEYQTVRGWNRSTAGIREFRDLPELARDYLKRISDCVHVEISLISTGPDRSETILPSPDSRLHAWFQ
jgi:adenylosuccinate synthase